MYLASPRGQGWPLSSPLSKELTKYGLRFGGDDLNPTIALLVLVPVTWLGPTCHLIQLLDFNFKPKLWFLQVLCPVSKQHHSVRSLHLGSLLLLRVPGFEWLLYWPPCMSLSLLDYLPLVT